MDMTRLLRWEADILYQKTREKWLSDGDMNSKFFHALIKDRRRRNTIKVTRPDGTVVMETRHLLEGAAQHFASLFTASPYILQKSYLRIILLK